MAVLIFSIDQMRFDARNFFDTSGSAPVRQRRQYGATIGGPISFLNFGEGVPAIYNGKDRSFFFFNIERDLDVQGFTITRVVPSAQARQGIFDLTSLGFGVIDGSNTGANNRLGLPINTVLQNYLNNYPLGNAPGEGPLPGVFDFHRFGSDTRDDSWQFSTRLDHKFNDTHSIRGSMTYSDGDFEFCCETFAGLDDSIKSPQTAYGIAIGFSSNFSTRVFNEFRLGFNRSDTLFTGAGDAGVSTVAAVAARDAINAAGSTVTDLSGSNQSFINFNP